MKKLILLVVLLFIALPLHAQRYKVAADIDTIDATTAQVYGMGDLTNALDILGWWIYNTDDADTLLVNMDSTAPTTANSIWIEPNKALSVSFAGIREARLLYINNSGIVQVVRFWKEGN